MKLLEYKENKQRGRIDFPIEYHHVTPNHPRYEMPYHWHNELEIIHVIEGTFHLTMDAKEITAVSGDIIFVNEGSLHGGVPEHCIYDCVVLDFWAFFRNNLLFSKWLEGFKNHSLRLPDLFNNSDTSGQKLILDLFDSLSLRALGYEFQTVGLLTQLVGHFIERHYMVPNSSAEKSIVNRIQTIKTVLDYIEKHYEEDISLDILSEIAGMSPRYFCRFFKEMTYKTPIDYLNYYRIEIACIRIIANEKSFTEIAFDCGFNDLNYFIRCFRKYKGVTPKQYLKLPFQRTVSND